MDKRLNQKLLRELGVRLVILFGSVARGGRRPLSDTDIGVVFSDPGLRRRDPVGVYGSLFEEFKKHFPEPLDIVYLDEAPPNLRYQAARDGQVLYEENFGDFNDYRAAAMLRYFDFQYYEKAFHASVLGK